MGVVSKPVHESVCHDWIGEDGMPVPSKIFICRDGAGRSSVMARLLVRIVDFNGYRPSTMAYRYSADG